MFIREGSGNTDDAYGCSQVDTVRRVWRNEARQQYLPMLSSVRQRHAVPASYSVVCIAHSPSLPVLKKRVETSICIVSFQRSSGRNVQHPTVAYVNHATDRQREKSAGLHQLDNQITLYSKVKKVKRTRFVHRKETRRKS